MQQLGDLTSRCTCWITLSALGNGDAANCFDGITDFDVSDCAYSSSSSPRRQLQGGNGSLFPNGSIVDHIKEAGSSIKSEMKNMMDPIYDYLGIKPGIGRKRSKCQNAKKVNLFNIGTKTGLVSTHAQAADTKSFKADAGNSTRNLLGSNDDDAALERKMSERFDRIDTKAHSLESKVTSIEESMKSLEGKLGKVEGKLGKVEGKLDQVAGIDTKVHLIEKRVSERIDTKFHSLETKMEKRMTSVEENMKSLGIKLDQVAELLIKLVGDSQLEEAL